MISVMIYLAACSMIAYLARAHKFGSLGWFFISFIFSPLIGGLGLFFIKDEVST